MTRAVRILGVCFLLLNHISQASAQGQRNENPQDQPLEEVLPVPEVAYERASAVAVAELPKLEEQAMAGSPTAAIKLDYYWGRLQDVRKQVYWLTIAVENGAADERLDLARALTRDADKYSRDRARFWYKQLIREGPSHLSDVAKLELPAWEKYNREHPIRQPK